MHPPKRIRWRGRVGSRWDVSSALSLSGDAALVSRGGLDRWIVFRCPCGCEDEVPINLDPRVGPAWRIYQPGKNLTVYPSVWRDANCESHFIVRKGLIWLIGVSASTTEWSANIALTAAVLNRIGDSPTHFATIADALGAEPWDVLDTCRALEESGRIVEVPGSTRGKFMKGR